MYITRKIENLNRKVWNSMTTYKYIGVNKYTRPGYKLHSVKAIIVHWTANPGATAINHYNYFNNGGGGRYASAQIFVDLIDELCIIPLDEVAYAANETGKSKIEKLNGNYGYIGGNANGCTISVEMCVEKNGTISEIVESKTVKLVAELCKKNGLTEKDIYRHYDVTGKSCPTPFIGNLRFSLFKNKIKKELNGGTVKIPEQKPITTKPIYFKKMPSTHMIYCKTNVGIYKTTAFNENTKLKEHYEPGDTVKVVSLIKSEGSNILRFKTSDGYFITSNKAYVKKYTPNSKSKVIGTLTTLVDNLNYYDSARWNNPTSTIERGTTLTIVQKLQVSGVDQYETISGTFVTAAEKYVKFTSK